VMALGEPDGVLAAVQMVTTSVPAPAAHLSGTDDPPAHSYLTLLGGRWAGVNAPAARRTWLVLRCDPTLCRSAVTARGGGTAGAHRALLGVAARLAARLQVAGVRARVLDVVGVIEALHFAGDVEANDLETSQQAGPQETWSTWAAQPTVHTTFAVRRWSEPQAAAATAGARVLQRPLSLLAALPASSDTCAITLAPARGSVAVTALVRVAGASVAQVEAACVELGRRAAQADLVLARLDGEHAAGVLATLPVAGVGASGAST